MIYPKKNWLVKWFFRNYFLQRIRYSFLKIEYDRVQVDKSRSILLVANHYSWWDAFLLYWLNERLFHKRFYVMTLEESFHKWRFLRYVGAFSVKNRSKDILKSIDFAVSLLQDPQNLVLVFPQGKMYSNFTDKLVLHNGISRIVKKTGDKAKTIFAVSFIESFKFKKPTAYIYLEADTPENSTELKEAFMQFYQLAKTKQSEIFY